MAEDIEKLVVSLGMDSTGFQSGVSELNREMAIVKQEFKLASSKLGDFGNSSEQLNLKANSLSKQLDIQKQKVQSLGQAYEESKQKSGENTKATDDLKIKLLRAQRQESELENQLKQTNSELKKQSNVFSQAGEQADKFGGILRNAFSVTIGMGFFDMIKTGFNYAKEAAFGFNSTLQQNQIAFSTMLGSAKEANKYIQGMMEYSSRTPFEFQDLAEGSKLLMAFGFEAKKIPGMIEAIGNAAAGLGMSGKEGLQRIGLQLGQMQTQGKATYQDLKQLAQAGVPVWDILSQAIGKSTGELQEMVSKGMLPAQETIDVLIAGMNDKFPNMMEKQSKSWQGLMSSIKDNISIALGTAIQSIFESLSERLEDISEKLQHFNEVAKDEGMKEALKTLISPALVEGLDNIRQGFQWIGEHGTAVKAALVGIGAGFATIKLAGLIGDMRNTIKAAGGVTNALKGIFTASPKVIAITAIVGVLAGTAYLLYRNWEHVPPFFKAMWDVVAATFETGKNGVMVTLRGMQVGVAEVLKFTLGNTSNMVAGMLGIFSKIPKIGDEFAKAQASVKSFSNSLDSFATSSKNSLNKAVADTKTSAGMISGNFKLMTQAGSKMTNAIGNDLSGMVDKAKNSFKDLGKAPDEAIEGFDTSIPGMEEAGANLVDAIGKGADKKKKKTKQKFEKIASEMNTAIILIDAEIKRLLADDSSLEVQQANIQKAMKLTADKIKILQTEFNRLAKAKNVNKETLNQLTREIENTKNAYDELGRKLVDVSEKIRQAEIKIVNDTVDQIKSALKRKYEEEREEKEKALNDELKDLDEWRKITIERINDVYDAKIKAIEDSEKARQKAEQNNKELTRIAEIKSRLQELSRMTIKDLETEEDKVEEVYNKRIRLIEEARDTKIKAINDEIAAIDKLMKDEDRADKDAEELKKINKLKNAIEFEHNEYNKAEMKKELDRLVAERDKRLRREQLEEQKEGLRNKIDIIQSEADEKTNRLEEEKQNQIEQIRFQERINQERIRLQDELNNIMKAREERAHQDSINAQIEALKEKQKNEINTINTLYAESKLDLQKKLEDVKEFYKIRLEDSNLQAEAEYMIMQNSQEEIIKLLYSYTDHYKVAGQTLGDKLVEGFRPAIKNIKEMIADVTAQIDSARSEAIREAAQVSTPSDGGKSNSTTKTTINKFETTINSPKARTPSQERRDWERTQRNMIFQAGLA